MTANCDRQSAAKRFGFTDWRPKAFTGLLLLLPVLFFVTPGAFFASSQPQNAPLPVSQIAFADFVRTSQPLELRGSLIANSQHDLITEFRFVLTPSLDTRPLDLNALPFTLRYEDATQSQNKLDWSWRFQSEHNLNSLLEAGELVQITVPLPAAFAKNLQTDMPFTLEVLSAQQTLLTLHRTTPTTLAPFMELN